MEDSPHVLNEADFEVNPEDKICCGPYWDLFKGIYKPNSDRLPVVVKIAREGIEFEESCVHHLPLFREKKHPGILPVIGLKPPSPDGSGATVLTPIMPNGTLADQLAREHAGNPDPRWDATRKSMCVFGIAAVMMYLHQRNYVDVKLNARSVFFDENFEPVVDGFGIQHERDMKFELVKTMLENRDDSFVYIAPEDFHIQDLHTTYGAGDVYAYGMLLYHLFSDSVTTGDGRILSDGSGCRGILVFQTILAGAGLKRPDGMPNFYWELITLCLMNDFCMRPSFRDILFELRKNRAEYAFPGSDLAQLKEYEQRVLQGINLEFEGA